MIHHISRRVRRRLGRIERDILSELTAGDMLYAFLLSGRSSKQFFRLARERANERYRRKLAIERLIDLDYIQREDERLAISESGRNVLGESIDKTLRLLSTKKWDGKWRIAAFDIPEQYASLRDRVRGLLKQAGFERLQNSVWVFPHECGELVHLIKDESRLSNQLPRSKLTRYVVMLGYQTRSTGLGVTLCTACPDS